MMLANLYRKAGQERSAVTSYKEVLRQCPVALDAIIGQCVSDGWALVHTQALPVIGYGFKVQTSLNNLLFFRSSVFIS